MKDNQAKYPQLRFKGFTDPWEQRKLSDFSKTTYGGGTPKTAVTEYWDGNIPWIQSSNLTVDDVQEVNLDKFITDDAIKNSAAKLIPANSIAIVTRVGVGKLTLMKQEFATSQDFLSLSELHVDEQFGLYSIYKLLQKELNNIQGTSIKGMTKADLLTKDIMIPVEKDEQIKIGSFFKQLDHLITLHQRKLAKLKELKQGYLQKLFPRNGSKFPQLRFAGFADAWEQRNFGELYKKNLERNKDQFSSDRTISIATMRFKKEGNGAAEDSLVSYKVLREGDIAFEGHTSKRFAFGRFVLNDIGDGIMSPRFTTLRPTQDMPIKFWKQYIHYEPIMRYPIVNSTKLGTMMNELVVDEFLNQPVLVPELSEQQKIGSFFKQLDGTITLHQSKLEKLQELKKGYLQKMFC
ncbi:restriction endonuclease subunit S [Levilactobacillus brevis]|uniref:restriction endonuclease subunit S n=1 Tax=Levilactobacillus brevis TaxID=1580 RepID=UPI000BE929CF|nr:restriction endonuclease subunit S [Levilactobacillus brevis]